MTTVDPEMHERVIEYIAAWVVYHIGEPTGEITIDEMREFLYQHGFELTPPDEETTFTAMDYWHCVIKVTSDRLANPDRVLKIAWKK